MKNYDKKAASPYKRHGKAPYKYGEHYNRWSAAVSSHGLMSEETFEADRKFRVAFGLPPRKNQEKGFGE